MIPVVGAVEDAAYNEVLPEGHAAEAAQEQEQAARSYLATGSADSDLISAIMFPNRRPYSM